MKLFKKIPMTFEEKNYEIRVLYDDATIDVVAFLNNHPANCFRHQLIIPKNFNVKRLLRIDAVKELVEVSKKDIIEKRWEKLSKVMH